MSVNMTAVSQPIVDAGIAETKEWLRIDTANDDATIEALVRAAIGMAEDFCGQRMFARAGVEVLTLPYEWTRLRACPVSAITAARALAGNGTTSALAGGSYATDITGDGDGWVRVGLSRSETRLELDIVAGMAADWPSLPEALRQGIVRLAAHLFTERENSDPPPAIVTALWRPWRRMRIA
ncbi:MAG: phage head-tail connector protein [Sphingobium sp.]|nr:phage head-tail connector protein [Sphingobium sp.]MCI1270821.1 phage head-tail connector protein [Sphingobium sp.]MCI1756746.1 phage head-tail connector protein [Sphingobium sp.]MCI2052332.1 phage head-tail connector protein [Sphingobium sp.]